jgi:hypothetical protein
MKKNIVIYLLLLFVSGSIRSQVQTSFFEGKDAMKFYPALKQDNTISVPSLKMKGVDVIQLLDEDKKYEGMNDVPFRFGFGFDVNYTLDDGEWTKNDSTRIWRLKIISPQAFSLNFILQDLRLSKDAELFFFNPDATVVFGPVTKKQNINKGIFLTDLIAGDEVTIQLIEPVTTKETSSFRITRIVHGYKNMFSNNNGSGTSLICNNNVACFPSWNSESNAVARVLLSSGTSLCSGSLLNNTENDYRTFFLTAFHCIDISPRDGSLSSSEIEGAENWGFQFNFKKQSCNGSAITTSYTYNTADFRAAWVNSDFALMELRNLISHNGVKFLGWNRSGNIPSSGTVMHHPN